MFEKLVFLSNKCRLKIERIKSFSEYFGTRFQSKMLQLSSMLFVCIVVGGFEIALSSKFYSPCLPGQPCNSRQPFYPPKPRSRLPALPVKIRYKNRTSKDSCIGSFVCTFIKKIRSCPELTEVFSCFSDISAEDFCYGLYPQCVDAYTAIGIQNPAFFAQQAVASIADSFDIASPDMVLQVYANSIAKILFTQGTLTPQNAVLLATQYADTMKEAASCYDSQFTVISKDTKCKPHYVVIPQHNPVSRSIFDNEPSVALFTRRFLQIVNKTPILREVFDLSQTTAKQYGDFLTQYAEKFLCELGVKNATALAELSSRAIILYFDVLTLPLVSSVYVNVAAYILFVNGCLSIDNANDHALAYAQAIADSAKVTMNADPTSKFPALMNGFVNFMYSLELCTKDNTVVALYYIGNEWLANSVCYE